MSRINSNAMPGGKLAQRCERAAVVVFRYRKRRLEFLLVSRNSDPDQYVLPGGNIEPGESLSKAARRECSEEAGVEARVLGPLVRFEHFNGRGVAKHTMAYLAEPGVTVPSPEGRDVVWARHDELAKGLYDVPYAILDVLEYAAQCLRKGLAAA